MVAPGLFHLISGGYLFFSHTQFLRAAEFYLHSLDFESNNKKVSITCFANVKGYDFPEELCLESGKRQQLPSKREDIQRSYLYN
jgi:hypothetical protein